VSSPQRTIRELSFLYVAALSTIAVLAIIGQVVIQSAIRAQRADSRVVNLAGRQRMLSQKLAKTALALATVGDEGRALRASLRADAATWASSQASLRYGDAELGLPELDAPEVIARFEAIEPHLDAMLGAVERILERERPPPDAIETLLAHEPAFLRGMDDLVFQLDAIARRKVQTLSTLEYVLLALTLLVLLLEGLFVFRPTIRRLSAAVATERKLEKEAVEAMETMQVRLGQELHDGVCQQLAGTAFYARAELRGREDGVPPDSVGRIAELVEDAAQQARSVALGLYPAALTDRHLADVLSDLGRHHHGLGWPVEVRADDTLELSHSASLHLYRVAQEALSNAWRHGQASSAALRLERDGGVVRLIIEDDGRGMVTPEHATGIGLRTMQHRASLLGGHIRFDGRPQGGTRVTLEAPLAGTEARRPDGEGS
jgi:signal transduction histidine kinase